MKRCLAKLQKTPVMLALSGVVAYLAMAVGAKYVSGLTVSFFAPDSGLVFSGYTIHESFFIFLTAFFLFFLIFFLAARLVCSRNMIAEKEGRFRLLFSQLGSGAVIYRPLGECDDFEIIDFNRKAEKIDDVSRKEVIGKPVTQAFPGVKRFGLLDVLHQVCRSGEAACHPVTHYNDGRLDGYRENYIFKLPSGDLVAIYDDATERVAAQQALEQSQADLEIDKRISTIFLTVADDEVYPAVLKEIQDILASPFGYLGYIDTNGSLVCPTMSYEIWEKCRMADKTIVFPADSWGGLWGKSLVLKKSMWSNENLTTPDGHVHLTAALAVPIIHNNKLIGQICLGNRKDGYAEREARTLERICTYLAPILKTRLAIEESAQRQISIMAQLTRNEARLKEAEELAGMGSWRYDIANKMGRWSDGMYHIFGLSPAETTGSYEKFLNLVHPDDQEVAAEGYQEALAGRDGGEVVFRIVSDTGSRKFVSARFRTIKDEEGNPTHITGTIIDISKRRQVEEELLQEKRVSDTIINSLPGAFYIYDDEFRLMRWNVRHEEMLGYSGKELFHKAILDFVSPPDRERVVDAMQRVLLGEEIHIEADLLIKDGSTAPFLCSGTLLEVKGAKYIQGMAIDISDRKKLERELRQAQKMEAIGTLAGGIAHDFNNILAAILGYGEMALEEVDPESLAKQDLEHVMAAGRRASALVEQILAFSRQGEVDFIPIQAQHIIKEALRMLRASLPTSIEIKTHIDNECPPIEADPTQIHQILMNLCTNAKHAMSASGGVLTVSISQVNLPHVDCPEISLEPGPYLELVVADTGEGMDEATKARIFDPFFSTKDIGKGTGLGLSVVHGIVSNHGGQIVADSSPGEGATFRIYLPISVQELKPLPASSAILPSGTETIMVVDDEEWLAQILQRSLANLGYRVSQFTNSLEALDEWRKNPDAFDLIITDMTMPHLSGADLTRKILTDKAETPIIMCTGFSEVINEEQAKELGVREFILKPFVIHDLAHTVRRVLDNG